MRKPPVIHLKKMPKEKVIKCCHCIGMKIGVIFMFILEWLHTFLISAVSVYNIEAWEDLDTHKDLWNGVIE